MWRVGRQMVLEMRAQQGFAQRQNGALCPALLPFWVQKANCSIGCSVLRCANPCPSYSPFASSWSWGHPCLDGGPQNCNKHRPLKCPGDDSDPGMWILAPSGKLQTGFTPANRRLTALPHGLVSDQDDPPWVMLAQSQGCKEGIPRILFAVALAWRLLTLLCREGNFSFLAKKIWLYINSHHLFWFPHFLSWNV